MTYKDKFTDEEYDLLVALPYRTGLWISESDDSGDSESEEAEIKTLEALIVGFAEDFCKSELVEEIMIESLNRKEQWPAWQENLESVRDECRRAINILQANLESKDIEYFQHNIMEIATTVAASYREFNEDKPLPVKIEIYWRYFREIVKARLAKTQPPMLDTILSISKDEQTALNQLSNALQLS